MLPRVHIARSPHSLSSHYHSHTPYDNTPLRFPTLPHAAMDPGVDFRAFYPYTPNEVKHRKRTTSDQLKILEGIFKRDTKPNAALRNELAVRLDMTPRGVQVWFQNRRAKEKSKAGKAANASRGAANGAADNASTDPSPSPPDADVGADAQLPAYLQDLPPLGSQESSPVVPPSPHSQALSESSVAQSWQPSSASDDQGFLAPMGDANLLRRGSLPVDMISHSDLSSHGPPLVGQLDPFSRRQSVDASLHRLSSNPYARPKNSNRLSGSFPTRNQMARVAGSPYPRPELPHVATAPINGSFHGRHVSADSRGMHYSPTGNFSSSSYASSQAHHAVRASLPDNHLYAFSSRMVASPIPGPLPLPGFSFGVANTNMTSLTPPSADSERSSPDPIRGYAFQGDDSEDDHNSSYDALSRFGSIASVATSDTSNGSYYSECAMDSEMPIVSRRASCSSNQFLGMMSNLDVNGLPRPDGLTEDFANADVDGSRANSANGQSRSEGGVAASVYSSPSTVSPGSTPSLGDEANSAKLRVPHSSELVYALQSTSDQPGSQSPYPESSSMGHDGQTSAMNSESPFMYVPDSVYPQSAVSAENRLPMNVAENFQYDNGELHHELPTAANYYPDSYSVEGAYASHNDGGDMNHYDHSSNLYGTYGTNPHENAPHSGTDFALSYP